MVGSAAQDEHEPFDISDVLPLLPVRELAVFDARVVPLFVSREIIRSYTREAGVRELTRELAAVCRKVVALASLVTGRPCRRRMAMTGEMTLRGRILAVGGLREKLLAARRSLRPRARGRSSGGRREGPRGRRDCRVRQACSSTRPSAS
jgi:hypothetical protein